MTLYKRFTKSSLCCALLLHTNKNIFVRYCVSGVQGKSILDSKQTIVLLLLSQENIFFYSSAKIHLKQQLFTAKLARVSSQYESKVWD